MASDDDTKATVEAAEFKHKLKAMVAAAETAKMADAARACVLVAAALLDETCAAAFLIEHPPPPSKAETSNTSLSPDAR
jgi:hypothetical protein